MKVVKTLRYYRHSDKDGKHISWNGLRRILNEEVNSANDAISDCFYGPLDRTLETLTAMRICPTFRGAKVHDPIRDIGNEDLFSNKAMVTDKFKELVKSGMSNLEALKKAHSKDRLEGWRRMAANGIKEMFEQMTGQHGIAVGHDPVISLAAEYFSSRSFNSLSTLEFIEFLLIEDGTICVAI